jgi:hypothetical protein
MRLSNTPGRWSARFPRPSSWAICQQFNNGISQYKAPGGI